MSLRRARRFLPALVVALASACAAAPAAPVVPPPVPAAVAAADTQAAALAMIREELFFGRGMPDGRLVSEEQWQAFVDSVVTPRFPDGLTVLDASGQWTGEGNVLVREPSKVLVILHPGGADPERAIREIIADYKQRFAQEAVLRVTTAARVQF